MITFDQIRNRAINITKHVSRQCADNVIDLGQVEARDSVAMAHQVIKFALRRLVDAKEGDVRRSSQTFMFTSKPKHPANI